MFSLGSKLEMRCIRHKMHKRTIPGWNESRSVKLVWKVGNGSKCLTLKTWNGTHEAKVQSPCLTCNDYTIAMWATQTSAMDEELRLYCLQWRNSTDAVGQPAARKINYLSNELAVKSFVTRYNIGYTMTVNYATVTQSSTMSFCWWMGCVQRQ